MGDKILKKYQQFFGKYQEETEKNILSVSKILRQKEGLFKYTITNIDLINFINLGSDICPEWHKNLFDAELSKRDKYMDYILSSFLRLDSQNELFRPFGFLYGKIVYFLFKDNNYKTFKIPKKNKKKGEFRIINAPKRGIKILQSRLSEILYALHDSKSVSHGFELNKNIVTNAKTHVNKRYVINMDLKDFFPTINFGRVRGLFKKEFNFNNNIATILAQICCYEGRLPQGAPTSPIISNLICKKLDSRLHKISYDNKFNYSRYADDLTFSTNLKEIPSGFEEKIKNFIKEEGFEVNENKYRIQNNKTRQEVTGLPVNKKVNIKRSYIREVRAILHCWKIRGYEFASKKYNEKYFNDKCPNYRVYRPTPNFANSIRGRIEYIGMVRGKEDGIYQNFLNEINSITSFDINIDIGKTENTDKSKPPKFEYLIKSDWKCLKHNPQETSDLLNQFSKDESGLKFLTHSLYDNTLFEIKSVLSRSYHTLSLYPGISKYLKAGIIEFFEFHNSDIIKNWCIRNPGKSIVSDCELEEYKNKLIEFKKRIRFNDGELFEFFEDVIKNFVNKPLLGNKFLKDVFKINYQNLEYAKFYTDTSHFRIALNNLLVILCEHSKKDKIIHIKYFADNESNQHNVEILDKNTDIKATSSKELFVKGNLFMMQEHLCSLCDWCIEATFLDGFKRVHMLPINKRNDNLDPKENEGIKHIFKFYY